VKKDGREALRARGLNAGRVDRARRLHGKRGLSRDEALLAVRPKIGRRFRGERPFGDRRDEGESGSRAARAPTMCWVGVGDIALGDSPAACR